MGHNENLAGNRIKSRLTDFNAIYKPRRFTVHRGAAQIGHGNLRRNCLRRRIFDMTMIFAGHRASWEQL